MANLIGEFQFCQMENEVLRRSIEKKKEMLERLKSEINFIFKENDALFSRQLEDGAIILTLEDRVSILNLVELVIKSN
jgi:hypothetical protein